MQGVRWTVARGLVAAAAALTACGKPGHVVRDPARWGGWYQSDTLRGAPPLRVVRLLIHWDSTAEVSVDYVGVGTTHHPGWWLVEGNEVTMQPTRGGGTPNELPFKWRFEEGRLVPLAWDHKVYGDQAAILTKLVAPARPADSTAGAKR